MMKKLLSQGIQFIGISGIGWLLDFTVFNILHIWSSHVAANNMVSSLVAVCFVFFASTRKTFVQKENGINVRLKFALYIVYQLLLITLISRVLAWIHWYLLTWAGDGFFANYTAVAAKIIVTPITMLCNFIVMKLLIERV